MKNLVLYMNQSGKRIMLGTVDWPMIMKRKMPLNEFWEFVSYTMYLYVAWCSGILLGYILRKMEE